MERKHRSKMEVFTFDFITPPSTEGMNLLKGKLNEVADKVILALGDNFYDLDIKFWEMSSGNQVDPYDGSMAISAFQSADQMAKDILKLAPVALEWKKKREEEYPSK